MPVTCKDDLKEKIDAFTTKVLITRCHSPYGAPAMLLPKKNGKLRLLIDYRKLNEQTIKSCRPTTSIEEFFDTLQGNAYFTTIDMSWGFYQLPLEPECQNYRAFSKYTFWTLQMATYPNGIDGQSEHSSKSDGTSAWWTHVENYSASLRILQHLFKSTKIAYQKTATSLSKVSRSESNNQSDKMCLFPNEI